MSAFYWVVYFLVHPPARSSPAVWPVSGSLAEDVCGCWTWPLFIGCALGSTSLSASTPPPAMRLRVLLLCTRFSLRVKYLHNSKPTLVAFVHFHQRRISTRFTSARSNDHKYSYLCSPSFRLLTCTHSCSTSTTSTRLFPQQRKRCVPFRIIGQALPIPMRCE